MLPDYRTYHNSPTPPLKEEELVQSLSVATFSDLRVVSEQMDSFWVAIYQALDSFPAAVKYLYNNQISIGVLFSPGIVRALTMEMANDSIVRKEIAKATDFISVNSYSKLGNSRAIVDMVIDATKVFRVYPVSKMNLLDDELEDYTFETEQGLKDLIESNVWLTTFYVLAYAIDFIAGTKLPELLNAAQTNTKYSI